MTNNHADNAAPGTVAERVARWATTLRPEDIPSEVYTVSRHRILDVIGVGLAGLCDRLADPLLRWATVAAGGGDCTALSLRRGLAPADAAFVNASLMHALDFDDMAFGGHGTSCVFPAAMAVAEAVGATDEDILVGYIAGMEVFGRLGLVTDVHAIHEYGFHPTGVLGLLGATVAACRVEQLPAETVACALAIAASGGSGVTANFGSMVKPLHAGYAAARGVQAAQLAKSGVTGRMRIFEEHEGYGTAYMRDAVDWARFIDGLGSPFRMTFSAPIIKQYPCCGGSHRSIQSLRHILREHALVNEQIVSVEARINRRVLTVLRYDWPADDYEGRFSLRFNLALTLVDGAPTVQSFTPGRVNDPAVVAAGEKVRVVPVDGGARHDLTVTVRTVDGREFSASETVLPGSSERPMSEQEVLDKFRSNVAQVLDPEWSERLSATVLTMSGPGQAMVRAWSSLRHAACGLASEGKEDKHGKDGA